MSDCTDSPPSEMNASKMRRVASDAFLQKIVFAFNFLDHNLNKESRRRVEGILKEMDKCQGIYLRSVVDVLKVTLRRSLYAAGGGVWLTRVITLLDDSVDVKFGCKHVL